MHLNYWMAWTHEAEIAHLKNRTSWCFVNYFYMTYGMVSAYMVLDRVAQIFHKSRSSIKIIGARGVTQKKFHTKDPQILGTIIQNLHNRMT
jgi:hypothetical protein